MTQPKQTFKKKELLIGQSLEAKKFWGKAIEDALPKPAIPEDVGEITPSLFLLDTLKYARGAESRGEWLYRENYLHPLFDYFSELYEDVSWTEDLMGNMFVEIGEGNGVLHVGHVDTVHDDDHSPLQDIAVDAKGMVSLVEIVKHSLPVMKKTNRYVEGTKQDHHYTVYELPEKQTRCLGADDGCAVAIMLYLIANDVEGTYCFTRGEEIGCIGTHYIMDNNTLDLSRFTMAIEVDRKGTTEIIGSMSPGCTASRAFASSLADQLNMGHSYSDKGSITDVGHMAKKIPECVNVAAGYTLQHSPRETTDVNYLDKLGAAMLLVDWEELVIERLPNAFTKPVSINRNNQWANSQNGVYTGGSYTYKTNYNSYGDYGAEPSENDTPFNTMYPSTTNNFAREGYVRANAGLIAEFLAELNISPADMHRTIVNGLLNEIEDDETTAIIN